MHRILISRNPLLSAAAVLSLTACSQHYPQTLITIADARIDTARLIDTGEAGDSVGDICLLYTSDAADECCGV